jgi:hypothetical protein
MSHGTPKVYVIKTPRSEAPPIPKSSTKSPAKSGGTSRAPAPGGGKALLLAYLAGPVTIARWLTGRRGLVWTAAGCGSLLTGFVLLMLRSRFDAWVETKSGGLMWWWLTVPVLVFLIGCAWARSVAAAGRMYPVRFSRLPRQVRTPAAIAAIGLVVPGLGLMLSGRPRLAGWSFALVAPAAAAAVVFHRWNWLWDRGRTPVPSGISGPALEAILIVTVAIASLVAVLWLVQALDGARRVTRSRSLAVADAASLMLLASIVIFGVAFRPATVAENLHATAVMLRVDGYQLIPLKLNEAAARLDPATPAYLAEAVELYGAAGMWQKAQEKRRILEARASEYMRLAQVAGYVAHGAPGSYQSSYINERLSPYNHLQRLRSVPSR